MRKAFTSCLISLVNVGSLLADAGDYAFTFGGGGGMAIQESSCNDFLDSHTKCCVYLYFHVRINFYFRGKQASMEVKEPRADFISFPRVMLRDSFIRNDAENASTDAAAEMPRSRAIAN